MSEETSGDDLRARQLSVIARATPEDIRDIAWLLSHKPAMTPPANWDDDYRELFIAVQRSYLSTDRPWDPYPALGLED